MKIITSAVLIGLVHVSFLSGAQKKELVLEYQLALDSNFIHVNLRFTPVDQDSSQFTYGMPPFGGQMDIMKGLQNMKVEAPATFKLNTEKRTVTFFHSSPGSLNISYHIVDTRQVHDSRSELFRPMVLSDYFFVHGVNLFLTPAFRNSSITALQSVQWKKLPAFPVFYGFAPGHDAKNTFVGPVDSIAFRLMTGAKDLSVKKINIEGSSNYVVLRKSALTDKTAVEIETFYVTYRTVLRHFWKDRRTSDFSLILQPYLKSSHKISGVSFGNGFIGKYNGPDSLAKGDRMFVISHELGHYWFGELQAFAGEHYEGQWFNEGFNDYMTFYNLMGAGLMTIKEFEKGLNKTFKSLYTSEIRHTPNDKIFENFWKLGDYSKLPYWRGCTFAFYLDNQISLATKGKKTIRDLMLALQEFTDKKGRKEFTNEEFIQVSSAYIPNVQVKKAFEEFIMKGTPINFGNEKVMAQCQVRYEREVPVLTIAGDNFIKRFRFK